MNELFTKTWQRTPTEEGQNGLIEDFIRNQIFYRESVAIGLDRDNEVLRRRLRQRMEFIYENISSLAESTNEDLRAFMKANREKYLSNPQTAFRQVYIITYKRGVRAEADARLLRIRRRRQVERSVLVGKEGSSFFCGLLM